MPMMSSRARASQACVFGVRLARFERWVALASDFKLACQPGIQIIQMLAQVVGIDLSLNPRITNFLAGMKE
ncbi:hypothetical protein VRRI112168_06320 [Vreelandella rituensis]